MVKAVSLFFLCMFPYWAWAGGAKSSKQNKSVVEFDFRGLRMGDPISPNVAETTGCEGDRVTPTPEYIDCHDPAGRIGDMAAGITYSFIQGRFSRLLIFFKSRNFSSLVATFAEKYGKPHQVNTTPVKTQAGVTFMNETALWHTDSGDLTVEKYFSDIESGVVTISSQEYLKKLQKDLEESTHKGAKDL